MKLRMNGERLIECLPAEETWTEFALSGSLLRKHLKLLLILELLTQKSTPGANYLEHGIKRQRVTSLSGSWHWPADVISCSNTHYIMDYFV